MNNDGTVLPIRVMITIVDPLIQYRRYWPESSCDKKQC